MDVKEVICVEDFDVYKTLQNMNKPIKEYDIEDQITFDDILDDLKDRSNF
mgnify:CR=1 FL=1